MSTSNSLNEKRIFEEYTKEEKSTSSLAKKYNTNPKRINTIIKRLGGKLRTKSEAQALALKYNRTKHPTAGTVRDESTKIAISEKVASSWSKISDEEYERRVENSRERWNNIPEQEREEMTKSAGEAIRVASKEGSKLEKYVCEQLETAGYKVLFHKKGLIINDDLELDMFLPTVKTAIEIDGPSHHFPIWGEEKFQKTTQSDYDKNSLLLKEGYSIIRVKNTIKNTSNKFKRELMSKLLQVLESLKTSQESKCITVDVGDN